MNIVLLFVLVLLGAVSGIAIVLALFLALSKVLVLFRG